MVKWGPREKLKKKNNNAFEQGCEPHPPFEQQPKQISHGFSPNTDDADGEQDLSSSPSSMQEWIGQPMKKSLCMDWDLQTDPMVMTKVMGEGGDSVSQRDMSIVHIKVGE